MKSFLRLSACIGLICVIWGCFSIECPVNNNVSALYVIGTPDSIKGDTITVYTKTAEHKDTILLNMIVDRDSFRLPMSHHREVDTLLLSLKSKAKKPTVDTIKIKKTNQAHFESIDCPISYFHEIQGITFTSHALNSVVTNHKTVNYDQRKRHITIYFKKRINP